MRKDNNLLDRFINNKLSFYEREELYNDFSFMKQVFLKTHDIDFYSPCSYNLKNNFDFTMFLIKLFRDDVNFVFKVMDYYINHNSSRGENYIKLLSIAKKILRESYDEVNLPYHMSYQTKILNAYETFDSSIKQAIDGSNDMVKEINSLGFFYLQKAYEDEEVVNFFVERLLYKLFYSYNFELYIHNKFENLLELTSKNETTILIDYIAMHDLQLSNYVCNRQYLLDEAKARLNVIVDNFDNFNSNKVDQLNVSIDNYLLDNNIKYTYKIDLIKMEEIKKANLDEEFYGKKLDDIKFINKDNNVFDMKNEMVRKYIRSEIERIYKIKRKKKEISKKNIYLK